LITPRFTGGRAGFRLVDDARSTFTVRQEG
jgi:hypothetical protein